MKTIPLTNGNVTTVDDADYERFAQFTWFVTHFGYVGRHVYIEGKCKRVLLHREVLNAPKGVMVDHINHDKLNNQRSNIRLCTHAENMRNRLPVSGGKSRFKGVCKHPRGVTRPYTAQIRVNGRQVGLGYFATEEDAARAYDAAAIEHYGEFAYLNFPDEVTA